MLGYYTTGGKAPEDGVIFGGEEIEYVGAELRPMLRVKYTLEDGNQVLLQEGMNMKLFMQIILSQENPLLQ